MNAGRPIMRRRAPHSMINPDRWRDIAAGDGDSAASLWRFDGALQRTLHLPIPHAAVAIEHALRQLLLERVLLDFRFVDVDPQARPRAGTNDAPLFFDREALINNVIAPRNVRR